MIAKWELECVCRAVVLCMAGDYTRCFRCGWNEEVSEKQGSNPGAAEKEGGRRMIVLWCGLSFFVGALFGVIVMALMVAGKGD